MTQDISNEMLAAYVDDELACSEKRAIAEEIKSRPEVADRAQALLELKASIKQAYPESIAHHQSRRAEPSPAPARSPRRFFQHAVAASLIMTSGVLLGIIIQPSVSASKHVQTAAINDTLFGIKVQPVNYQTDKVLLHISSAELSKLDFLLTRTERLLTDSRNSQHALSIEVIANSDGIDLLRKNTSPYAQRIKNLQTQYSNLQFIACKNSIRRLKKKGYDIQMLDGVKADKPALDTIINRMDKGWTYVKI